MKQVIIGKAGREYTDQTEVCGRYQSDSGEAWDVPLYICVDSEWDGTRYTPNQFLTVWVKVADYSFVGSAINPRSERDFAHRVAVRKMIAGLLGKTIKQVELGTGPGQYYLRQD